MDNQSNQPQPSETTGDPKTNQAGRSVILHLLAIVFGAIMTIVGVGMMVTLVLLPMGIGLAIAGVLMLTWGLYSKSRN